MRLSDSWKTNEFLRLLMAHQRRIYAIILASPGNGVRFQARLITNTGATSDTAVATPE